MVQDNKLVFSEFFMLVREEGRIVLRLKLLGNDFTGWKEKDKSVNSPLLEVKGKTAWFGGLTDQL